MFCFKVDLISIKFLEDEYVHGLDSYKIFLQGRIMLKKGESSPTTKRLNDKLNVFWNTF